MKRGAEKQISKDDFEKDEGQDDSPQVGFQRADESVLATRPIRGLPKRASVASVPAPVPQNSSIKFAGFSGFSGSSNSFSGLTATASSTTTPTSIFGSAPATQTNTAKSLTSLLSATRNPTSTFSSTSSTSPSLSASPLGTPPAPASAASQLSSAPKDETVEPAELKYYTSLRGLNESLRAAVGKAIDDDPFSDISVFFERYKSLRADIQKDYNGKTTSTSSSTAAVPTSAPVTKTFTMPLPPKDGFIFGGQKVSTSTETKTSTPAASTGFIPTLSTSSNTNLFGVLSDKSKKPDTPATSSPIVFGTKPAEPAPMTMSATSFFSQKPSETSKDQSMTSSSSIFNPFAPTKPPAPTIDFGSKPATTTGPSPSFTFGSGSSSSFSIATPSSTVSTGDSSAPTPGKFAGFASFTKPAMTSSSFGMDASLIAPPKAPSLGLGPTPTSSTLTNTASGSSTNGGDTVETATDDTVKRNIAESFVLNADNKHDQEGAGEEDEETTHAVKLKAYVMKDEKGAKSWVELGYGVLRIKKHKETLLRRVLLRSSSTGQILINFSFHSAFKPTQKGKNVTFLGHDTDGASKMYTLKLQSQEQASALAEAFGQEIKAREGSS